MKSKSLYHFARDGINRKIKMLEKQRSLAVKYGKSSKKYDDMIADEKKKLVELEKKHGN